MAAIVIAAAGAGIGYAVGGTFTAAALGWSIGSMLAPKPTQKQYNVQPLLSDLRVTGGEYGQTIPWVKGTVGIAGQMWWNTDRRARTTTTVTESGGGKGGGGGGVQTTTTTTVYDMDCLIGLTNNVIIGISRIWDNGKLIYTADASATGGSLAASISSPYWTRMTVYTGASDQEPDPTYETAVTTAEACAYRGRGTVFIQALQLGQSGQVPNLTFEVVTAGSLTNPIVSLFSGSASVGSYSAVTDTSKTGNRLVGEIWLTNTISSVNYLQLVRVDSGVTLFSIAQSVFGGGLSGLDSDNNALAAVGATIYRLNKNVGALEYITMPVGQWGGYGIVASSSGNLWATDTGAGGGIRQLSDIDWDAHTVTLTIVTGGGFGRFARNAAGVAGRIYGVVVGTNYVGYVNTTTFALTSITSVATSQVQPPIVGRDGNIYVVEGNDVKKYSSDGALLGSVTVSVTGGYALNIWLYDGDGFVWAKSTETTAAWQKINVSTMAIDSTVAAAGSPSTATGFQAIIAESTLGTPVFFDTLNNGVTAYGRFGYLVENVITNSPPTVQTVQSDVCLRAGLAAAQFDVTGLSTITRTVRSLAWSQISSARSITELLMSAYFYEMVVSDKIYFRPRGAASQATLAYNDLGAHTGDDQPEPLALRQANDIEIPAQIALSYINVSDDYQTDTQYSDRLESAIASTVATVQMALGMTPAEAKAVADTMLLDQAVSAVGTNIALLGEYARLEPTDPVTVTDSGGNTYRMRLVKKTDSYPLLTYEAVLDDVSILTSQESTSTDYDPQTTVDPEVNTLMRLLDIPILRDEDDDAGFYVAVKGDGTPYPGSAVFNSPDNVTYTRRATVLESGVFGLCTTTLGDWTGSRVFDEVNTVTVNVGSGTLASSTMTAVLDDLSINSILIGDEAIQFLTATLVSAGVYTLSRLLRGCRGTEWASTGHAAGERAVLLRTSGLRRILLQNNELGLSRYYKGVTLGRAQSTATASTFTNTAIGRKPFSPIIFKAGRDTSNNITFVWQRRTRLAVRMIGTAGISAPLGEDTESYEIDVYSNSGYTTVVRTITATSETASYTAAQQTTDGLTPGNTVYCKVYQISAQVGRGYALQQAA